MILYNFSSSEAVGLRSWRLIFIVPNFPSICILTTPEIMYASTACPVIWKYQAVKAWKLKPGDSPGISVLDGKYRVTRIYNSALTGMHILNNKLRRARLKTLAEFYGVPVEEHIGKIPGEVVPDFILHEK
jgi:hypothetical protein